MRKFLNKGLIVLAFCWGILIVAIWILPFLSPLPWQTPTESSYYDEDIENFYIDTWPPQ